MSTYAIGDIQGCYEALQRLLELIEFDPGVDQLWFVGDLVNRGPRSLEVLRLVRGLDRCATVLLGNHDLHLLCVAAGVERPHRSDTIARILEADDRAELLEWLRQRPLMHRAGNFVMVHAGLLPQWSIDQALALAREVEAALRAASFEDFLAHMYGNQPDRWDDALTGYDRLRVITNAMTRMRLCTSDGRMEFTHKSGLDKLPRGYLPWFAAPHRRSPDTTILFGHWSALGLKVDSNLIALDTGCLWGGALSAIRLEDRRLFQIACAGMAGTKALR